MPVSKTMRRHEFEAYVDSVLEDLPDWVVEEMDNVIVVVEETPPSGELDLLGLYDGVTKTERDFYSGVMPDKISIFFRPHLALGLPESELKAEIRKTVLHELGHHLGIDDARLTELGWD